MKVFSQSLLAVAMLFGMAAAATSQSAEVPRFADDFSTSALLAELWKTTPPDRWKVADGVLGVSGGGASAAPKGLQVDGPVAVSFRMRVGDFGKGNNWVGANVRGILFSLTPGGFWHVYRSPAQERSLGGIQTTERPETGRWYAFRIEQDGDRYRWLVDGAVVADFREPNVVRGSDGLVSLASSGPQADYDDISIASLESQGDISPNFIQNASFENVYDIVPFAWKPTGISTIPPARLWARWGVDTNAFWHGRQSLRVESGEKENPGFMCHQTGMPVGLPCTFSVYLKADRPELRASLMYFEYPSGPWKHKEVRVGTEWARHTFTVDSPSNRNVRVGAQVVSGQAGTLWADAAQIEMGTEATPFALAHLDSQEAQGSKENSGHPIPQDRDVPVVATPPVLDGKLDDPIWTDATRAWPLTLPAGATPREKTDAWMAMSGTTLYLGMRCQDSAIGELKAGVTEHDGPVYGDDCVEILLDTKRDRKTYYHLVVNALGTRFDAGPGRDIAWNHAWEAKTHRGADFWSVEVALPLAAFSPSPELSNVWGVNLCRSNHKAGEFSSTAVPESAIFHCPALFPGARISDDAFAQMLVVPEALELMRTPEGGLRFAGRLANRTGAPQQVEVRGGDAASPWTSGVIAVPSGGRAAFAVDDFPGSPDAPEARIRGIVRAAGATGGPLHEFTVLLPVKRVLDGMFERSFHSLETSARFRIQIALPPAALATNALVWRIGDQESTLTGETLSETMAIDVPLDGLAPGLHPFQAVLKDGAGREIARLDATLDKRPPMRNAVPIDRPSRAVVADGRPFFVFAPLVHFFPHTSPEHIDRVINHFADAGFRSIMVVGRQEIGTQKWGRVFERCHERNLKLIAWPGGFSGKQDNEIFRSFIERWREHPALLAWLPVDEPELYATPEATRATIEFYQKLDPHHPVYANNTVMGIPSRFAGLPGDLLSIDDYLTNREGRKVEEIVRQVEIMEQAARPTHRPVWIFLVGNNLYNHTREPTAAEQVAESYGSAVAGASGLIYFMGDPAERGHWLQMQQLNAEFAALESVLLSATPAPEARCSSGAIRFATRRVGSDVYLISVNLEDSPVEATFAMAGVDSEEAAVLFEERMARFEKGALKTTFAPHARQVYRVTLSE